jgi:hypothetical protein
MPYTGNDASILSRESRSQSAVPYTGNDASILSRNSRSREQQPLNVTKEMLDSPDGISLIANAIRSGQVVSFSSPQMQSQYNYLSKLQKSWKKINGVIVSDNPEYNTAIQRRAVLEQKRNAIQADINHKNSENAIIKNDTFWSLNWDKKSTVDRNEQELSKIRKEYDDAAAEIDAIDSNVKNNNIPQYLDISGEPIYDMSKAPDLIKRQEKIINDQGFADKVPGITGPKTPTEWLKSMEEILSPTYAEEIKNKYGGDLIKAYSESLKRPYDAASQNILENLSSRGLGTSGIAGNALAELAASKNLNLKSKQDAITNDVSSFLSQTAEGEYGNAVKSYAQKLQSDFEKSGMSWNDFYNKNQAQINADLNKANAQSGIDFSNYQNQVYQSDQDYLDQIEAINNLYGTVGQVAGNVGYNYTNKTNAPVTQTVMNYPSSNSAWNNVSNKTNAAITSGSNVGSTYDPSWLNY